MAPKKPATRKAIKAPIIESSSKELVPVGPRGVSVHKSSVKRDENGKRPTTSRALVLRNGKHGAMGTGEVSAFGKLSGREKLDLLAGERSVGCVALSKKLITFACRGSCRAVEEGGGNPIQISTLHQDRILAV